MIKEALMPVVSPVRKFPPIEAAINALGGNRFVQDLAFDFLVWRNISNLMKSEKESLKEIIRKAKKGERMYFSELGDILRKTRTQISGADCLDELQGTAILVLSNHPTAGPLKGWAHTVITSSEIRERTGKEILWAHGEDRSTFQDLARKKLSELSQSTILVRGSTSYEGTKQMVTAFNNRNAVGIHPEGDGYNQLGRAVADAGHLIFYAAYKNIPIICSAGFFDPTTGQLHTSFFRINQKQILELASLGDSRQRIADFAMTEIAKRLPPEKRGFYS